jgi:hypothetical protein
MSSQKEVTIKDVLRELDLGNSVAEFDNSLEKYFVENEAFNALVNNRADIIAGDKGTGKTAVYRILRKRYASMKKLEGIEVIEGFNPAGNPIFQRLVQQQVLTEGQYASVWKAYIFSLVGNWLIAIVGSEYTENVVKLNSMLEAAGLRSRDEKAETVFGRIVNAVQSAFKRTSATEIEFTFSESGIPIVKPRIEFAGSGGGEDVAEVSHEAALGLLDACLKDFGYTVWIALDRLDEAFQGFPDVEIPALRALFRTYLDLLGFDSFRLKIFVRRDLFRKIIGKGFVNLTHINARKAEIVWEDGDLLNLLAQRVRDNKKFAEIIGIGNISDEEIFYRIFPGKVDQAERKPTTLNWMMSRIRDANNVKPPRNLIDLANYAREKQIQIDNRSPSQYVPGLALVHADAIRGAQERLSEQRVTDTLFAEAGEDVGLLIAKFRRAKAEHNISTLQETLGLEGDHLNAAVLQLMEVGFLEELRNTWKIPMLYRDGLDITQGKAFAADGGFDLDAEIE